MDSDLSLLLDSREYEKLIEASGRLAIKSMKDVVSCYTPNCNGVWQLDPQQPNHFTCRLCKKSYCTNCRLNYTEGHSCNDAILRFQQSQASKIKDKRFQCDLCMSLMRSKGSKLKCTFCGFEKE